MPRGKVVPINRFDHLVDAKAIAAIYDRTPQWVNGLARKGVIRWHGVRSGVKICRRFDPHEVREDLLHGVGKREVSGAGA